MTRRTPARWPGYIATQLLVWETVVGERDSQFNHVDANAQGKNNIAEYISAGDIPCTARSSASIPLLRAR